MKAFSSRYEAALALAATVHQQQVRRSSGKPFILHPVHAAAILERYGYSEDAVIAALLHDTVEDAGVTLEQIAASFGREVMQVVDVLTEVRYDEQGEISWENRRSTALARLQSADLTAVAVRAAETLHNAATLIEDIQQHGPTIWSVFHRGPKATLKNYHDILAVVVDRLSPHDLVNELAATIDQLELTIARQEDAETSNAEIIPISEA